jgi:pyruvate/2-oxoglutarate dehydrogenase complex dihydrolipoamide acyltransferase (E2) component
VVHELRLEYVEIGNAIAQAVKEGKIQPQSMDGGGVKLSTGGGAGGATGGGPRLAGPGL